MERPKILVVDDDEVIRKQMKWALADEYEVLLAEDRTSALERMRAERPTLVALDLGLPPAPRDAEEGLQTLAELLRIDPLLKVVVVTGNQERVTACRAIEQGACDYFTKPVDVAEVKTVLRRAGALASLQRESLTLAEPLDETGLDEIAGESPAMQRVFAAVRKVATTDAPVLVMGESGTGKELVAKAIHRLSGRRAGPFVPINCGAIPDALLESELFGHERGSFTSADSRRKGKIEYAAAGTLFLDEIGELSGPLQVKLLRFLQEHQVERIGGRELIAVDVRVLAATNRDLRREIAERRFREDLYYRLGVVTIVLPPLRERGEDVVLLARLFLRKFSVQHGKETRGFTQEALAAIRSSLWPGNVRELENRVRRALIMSEGRLVTASDLELAAPPAALRPGSLRDVRQRVEEEHVREILARCNWNISHAAIELGISRPTLHDLIKRYRIARDRAG